MTDDVCLWSISQLAKAYRNRSLSPVEVADATFKRLSHLEPLLRSFITMTDELAFEQARQAETEMAQGVFRGPLHGIPVSFKDLVDLAGVRTTAGSPSLKDNTPDADADIVRRIKTAGALIVGKNTAYEFGLGLPMPGDWPPPTRNPWDLERIPGGSSSGSAAAVFAGLTAGSYGTDTGGSIRGPASYCGVVGLKPSSGHVSTNGVIALSNTLDHVGPMARTVEDSAFLLGGAWHGEPLDLNHGQIGRTTIGVPRSQIESTSLGPGMLAVFEETVSLLESLGAHLSEITLPDIEATEQALLTIIGFEGWRNHRTRLERNPTLYGPSAYERLLSGAKYSESEYSSALNTQEAAMQQMARLFNTVDMIVSPVTHTTAPTFTEYATTPTPRTHFTGIYNLAGAPAISLPCALDTQGLPIGFQIAGPQGYDLDVLSVARDLEEALEFPSTRTESAARFQSPTT
jgi:aspartyl-tRNA(Asn)/glutamyl-tRNA(Gln) amidotransferase subunit A